MSDVLLRTVVPVEGIGLVVVETVDFTQPGYEVCGHETVTSLPDGRSFSCGPDNGETPAELHAAEVADLATNILWVYGTDADRARIARDRYGLE